MAKLTCRRKLQVELRAFLSSPPPFLPLVAVDESDICCWHYLLQGPPDTPYEGGWYIGKLRFPVRAAARKPSSGSRSAAFSPAACGVVHTAACAERLSLRAAVDHDADAVGALQAKHAPVFVD